jgi:hypothetical protein
MPKNSDVECWCPAANRKSWGSVKHRQRWVSEGEVADRLRNTAAAEPYGEDLDAWLDSQAVIFTVDTDKVGLHKRRFRQPDKRGGLIVRCLDYHEGDPTEMWWVMGILKPSKYAQGPIRGSALTWSRSNAPIGLHSTEPPLPPTTEQIKPSTGKFECCILRSRANSPPNT